jgi:hypothetical protein
MSDYISSHTGADLDAAVTKIQTGVVTPQNYLYVSKNGNDSNNGSADKPFLTVQAAINAAASGTTVFIFPGTYNENLTLKSGVNLTSSIKFGITIVGNHIANFTGTVVLLNIFLSSTTGNTLTFSGTNSQNLQLFGSSIYSNSGDAIYYSNTNVSSKIYLEDGTCYVSTSGSTARCFYSESSAKGGVIANRVTFYINNTANIALSINGAIGFTHTSDIVSGQIVVSNTGYYIGQLVALTATGVPCLTTNSSGVSILFACTLTSSVTPIQGAGAFVYSAISYSSTGVGAALTINGGAGATPMPLSSIQLRSAPLKPTPVDGLLEYNGTNLYFTKGTTRSILI